MTSKHWEHNNKKRLNKNWANSLAYLTSSSPTDTISDVLTAELLKGGTESALSSSRYSRRRSPSRPGQMVADTELSVLGPLYDSLYYSRLVNADNLLLKKDSSNGSLDAAQRRRATLNQIPEQFSEFILEQGVNTESTRTRQISDLMGSQATIFSTRDTDQTPSDSSRARQKNVKAGIDYTADGYGRPQRRNAIRFRPGSKMYRIYMRMKRYAAYVKNRLSQVWKFVAKSKRTGASVKLTRLGLRSRNSQSWFKRRDKGIHGRISGPVNNPRLGASTGAERVNALTEEVREMAGTMRTRSLPGNPFHENLGKLSHLSNYIKEQKDMTPVVASSAALLVPQTMDVDVDVDVNADAPPPPPPHKRQSIAFRDTPEYVKIPSSSARIDEIEDCPDDDSFAAPTIETKEDLRYSQKQESLGKLGVQLWKQYLSNVIALRIRLRQEIALFQALAAGQAIPSYFNKVDIQKEPSLDKKEGPFIDRSSTEFPSTEFASVLVPVDVSSVPIPSASPIGNLYQSKEEPCTDYIMGEDASIPVTSDVVESTTRLQKTISHNTIGSDLIECKPSSKKHDISFEYSMSQFSNYSANLPSNSGQFSQTSTSPDSKSLADTTSVEEDYDKFHKVLNRRSMLGEMLDYDSDEDDEDDEDYDGASTIMLQTSHDTIDSQLIGRYGTILTVRGGLSQFVSRSSSRYSTADPSPGLIRSPGFNTNLHLV